MFSCSIWFRLNGSPSRGMSPRPGIFRDSSLCSLEINPAIMAVLEFGTMTVVRASQKTPAGMATYANSITLTPGTITAGVSGNEFTVHALVRAGALDLEDGGMDRRVSRFEGLT